MSLGKVNYNYQSSSTSIPLELDPFWKDYEMQLNGVRIYYFTFYTEEFNYSFLDDLDKRIRETVEKEGYIHDEDFHYPLVEPYSISSHFNSNDYGVINSFSVQYNRKYLVTTFYIDNIYILDEGEIRFDKPYGANSISNSFYVTSKINQIIQTCIWDEFKDQLGKNVGLGMGYSPTLVYTDYFCIKEKETGNSTWWIRNYSYDYEIENKFNRVLSFFTEEGDKDYVIKNFLYYESEEYPYYYLNRTLSSFEPRRVILISNWYKEDILDVSNNYAKIIFDFYKDYAILLRQNNRLEEIDGLYTNILYASDNITGDVYTQALADLNQYSYNLDEYQKEENNYKKAAHFFGMDEIVEKADEYYLNQRNIIQRSYDRHLMAQNNANSKLNQKILFINFILLFVTIILLIFTIIVSGYDVFTKIKDKEKYNKYILLYRNKKIKGRPLFSVLRKN